MLAHHDNDNTWHLSGRWRYYAHIGTKIGQGQRQAPCLGHAEHGHQRLPSSKARRISSTPTYTLCNLWVCSNWRASGVIPLRHITMRVTLSGSATPNGHGGAPQEQPWGRRGRRKGCKNASVSRPASRTVRHRPVRCGFCGSSGLRVVRTTAKNVTDTPLIPRMEVTCHVVDECECGSCGRTTVPETGLIKGTSLGPNLLKMATGLWAGKMVH